MESVAEKYIRLANKHPQRIPEFIDALRNYMASGVLRRGFGESIEDYWKRSPQDKHDYYSAKSACESLQMHLELKHGRDGEWNNGGVE